MARRNAVPSENDGQSSNGIITPDSTVSLIKDDPVENNTSALDQEYIREEPVDVPPPPPRPAYKPPNPDIMKNDPMAEMFGPGSTLRQIGDESDEMPDEIRGLIEENGLARRDFTCTLKEIPEGSLTENLDSSAASRYIQAWKRAIPSTEWIAREQGPGSYILVLSWRQLDREENRHTARREIVPVIISEKCAAEHKRHKLNQKINAAAVTSQQVREAITESAIEGQLVSAITGNRPEDKKQTPKEYLEELMSTVRLLGLPVGGLGGVTAKIDWDKILTVAIPGVTAILTLLQQSSQRRSEENMRLFMMMISQNQASSNQMLEMVKANANKPAADNPLKELQQMVMSAMDIKEMMNPAKETLSDKIFRVVEAVVPQILTIAATARQSQQAPSGPAVTMTKMYVKADPDFEKLKNDPAEMEKFVNRLDDRIGWENADVVLGVVEWPRPSACLRDPSKRFPPQQTAEDGVIDETEPPIKN